MRRSLSSVGVLTLACMSSTASLAQGAAPVQAGDTQAGEGVGDIIVTAQRRSESLQRSSLSIQVLGADEIARTGVVSPRDLAVVAPGLSVSQSGANTQTFIRGVGDFSANALAQLAVLYTIDGVNIERASAISSNFYDLARIEVLKGPQGTLYGRNATGGAINLITNRPDFSGISGYVSGEYGNYDKKQVAGALNLPLTDALAVRGAFQIIDRDGYLSDGTDDDIQQGVRLQALWKPTDRVSLRLSADYAHQGGKGAGAVLWPRQAGTGSHTSITDPINLAVLNSFGPPIPNFVIDPVDNTFLKNRLYNLSAELNVDIGDLATLTVLPAYRKQNFSQLTNSNGFPLSADEHSDQTSLEVRLGHQSEALKWVIGGYYFDLDTNSLFNLFSSDYITGFRVENNIPKLATRSYAAFGEATYSVTDRLRLIGGIRYTSERKTLQATITDLSIVAPAPQYSIDNRVTKSAVTWKGGAEYDLASQSMVYVTVSRGFKSGGFFIAANPDNRFEPEQLTAYTIGLRNRFFGNRLQLNIEGYYWDYKNLQVSSVGFTSSGASTFTTRNAGAANPHGVDVDLIFKPTRFDVLSGTLSWIDSHYKKFLVQYPAFLAPSLVTGCAVGPTTGAATVTVDCSAFPTARTPRWSGNVNYQHTFELAGGASILAGGGASFATKRYLASDFFGPETLGAGYVVFNADLTFKPAGEQFSITGYIRNIGDRAVYQGSINNLFNGNYSARAIGAPRTYGVRASYNF